MTYTLHRFAEHDLESAFQFYRERGSGKLALRSLDEFERVATLLDREPGLGTPTIADRKVHPFCKFPYSVIYKQTDTGIRIFVVRHDRREPEYGSERS